jgi:hypothetical protein
MIRLVDLLQDKNEDSYKPYMYSPVGFGCHVCKFHYQEDGVHKCNNTDYIDYMGTENLIDEEGNPVEDPSKWCSNWFLPIDANPNK